MGTAPIVSDNRGSTTLILFFFSKEYVQFEHILLMLIKCNFIHYYSSLNNFWLLKYCFGHYCFIFTAHGGIHCVCVPSFYIRLCDL